MRAISRWFKKIDEREYRRRPKLISVSQKPVSNSFQRFSYAASTSTPFFHESLKDEVLYEVCRSELSASGIEGLEDLLSVLFNIEIDDDELQEFAFGMLELFSSNRHLFGTILLQPHSRLLGKESMSFDESRVMVL